MKRARVSSVYYYNGSKEMAEEEAMRSRRARIHARRAQKYKSMLKTANARQVEKKKENAKKNHEPTAKEEALPVVVVDGGAEMERPSPSPSLPSPSPSPSPLPLEWWEECTLLGLDIFPYWEMMNHDLP